MFQQRAYRGPAALIVLSAAGLASGQYAITWSTVDGGGMTSSNGGLYQLAGTIGQPDAGPSTTMMGGSYELTGGFWSVTQSCHCLGDMNDDGRRDGQDVHMFVTCLTAGGSCACADVNAASGVTLDDIPGFVMQLLGTTICP